MLLSQGIGSLMFVRWKPDFGIWVLVGHERISGTSKANFSLVAEQSTRTGKKVKICTS